MIENSPKVDQYYYGARPDVQRAGVQVGRTDRNLDLITFSNNWLMTLQYIIESVVKELAKVPAKKFIQVKHLWKSSKSSNSSK